MLNFERDAGQSPPRGHAGRDDGGPREAQGDRARPEPRPRRLERGLTHGAGSLCRERLGDGTGSRRRSSRPARPSTDAVSGRRPAPVARCRPRRSEASHLTGGPGIRERGGSLEATGRRGRGPPCGRSSSPVPGTGRRFGWRARAGRLGRDPNLSNGSGKGQAKGKGKSKGKGRSRSPHGRGEEVQVPPRSPSGARSPSGEMDGRDLASPLLPPGALGRSPLPSLSHSPGRRVTFVEAAAEGDGAEL